MEIAERIRSRAVRRSLVAIAALLLCASCASQIGPTPGPTTTANATTIVGRPRFDAASYLSTIQSRGRVRIAIRDDNAPFSSKNAAGAYEGFEIDLARELARGIFGSATNLDQTIEWVPVLTATRQAALDDGRADLAVATIAITDERRKQLDLSATYFRTGQRLLIKKTITDITGPEDLGGKTVCIVRGSTSVEPLVRRSPLARPLLLDSYAACLQALQRGQTDAISTDEAILFGLARQDPDTKLVGPAFTEERYGAGAKRDTGDRAGLIAFVDEQLTVMVRDGRWAASYRRWITPFAGDEKRAPD